MAKKVQKPKLDQRKVIAVILTALIIASIGYVAVIQRLQQRQLNDLSTLKMALLVNEAVNNLHEPLPIDAQTGQRYIPEVRLRLPANSDLSSKLEYYYNAAQNEFPEELRVSSVAAMGPQQSKVLSAQNFEMMFEAIPKLQACSRGFQFVLGDDRLKAETGYTVAFEKALADGRALHVYYENECPVPDYFDMNYLKQIDSY